MSIYNQHHFSDSRWYLEVSGHSMPTIEQAADSAKAAANWMAEEHHLYLASDAVLTFSNRDDKKIVASIRVMVVGND